MGLSYYKTFKFPGGSLNFSKSGMSASFGFTGNKININHKGRVLYTARYQGFAHQKRLFNSVSDYRETESFQNKVIDFLIAQVCILIPFTLLFYIVPIQVRECIKGDCTTGTGKAKLSDGTYYSGGFKNGEFEGKGTLSTKHGKVLKKGEWSSGKMIP